MLRSNPRLSLLCGLVALASVSGMAVSEGDPVIALPEGEVTMQVIEANRKFAFDLYQQLAKENPQANLFFSPYSVSQAIAMTAEGARGETAEEMGTVLCFPESTRRSGDDAQLIPWDTRLIHTGMAFINKSLQGDDPEHTAATRARVEELRNELVAAKAHAEKLQRSSRWDKFHAAHEKEVRIVEELNKLSIEIDQYEIRVANALWGEKSYLFRKEFTETIGKYYDTGGVFSVDFRNETEAARIRINSWVEDQTNDRIRDLIPRGALNNLTRLVLTNAIYFKGEWARPFNAGLTKDRDFTLTDGRTVMTPIMHARELKGVRYGAFHSDGSWFETPRKIERGQEYGLYPDEDGFAAVELLYKGKELAMVVIAPLASGGLPALEARLKAQSVGSWIERLEAREVEIYLPKFKLETSYKLGDSDGQGALPAMGMVRAFVKPGNDPADGADFSGMTASADPIDQLYISAVLHKAFVEVNEEGTEAAAATAVVTRALGLSAPDKIPFIPVFRADRPFIFMICDRSTGSILFLGRMMRP